MSQPLDALSRASERAVLFDRYGMIIFAYIRKHTSTVVTLSSAQAFASLKVHAAVGSRWLVTLLACSDEKAC
jgi:hypothetical protein